MDVEEQEKPIINTNDENNNCEYTTTSERRMIVPEFSSDGEYSCSSDNDSEFIPIDTRQLWHDLAHLIKCIYRETNREFTENHSANDLSKAKESVQILTQSNAESLFNRIELLVLEYVEEIRNQVLKRSQTCLKTSKDVQLFISYLLDEYNTFIQAAKNVSTIVSYLEEQYMKSFHLTWLFYNKHLYEKLVYMDKKIQHSMSIMIDLLQPSNENTSDYSPAEYTQLLNRFLAFDEEMSEIACLYKDCQAKMTSILRRNRVMMKKPKSNGNRLDLPSTTAVNIPVAIDAPTIVAVSQQDSNGSSIGKESSSISSFDEFSLGNNTSSSSFTKEEHEEELDREISPPTNEEKESISNGKRKSKSTRRKEPFNPVKTSSLTPDLILPPKPPSKRQTGFLPLTMPLLTKTEIPACPSLISKKIQSVSFTAGTFGSITTSESSINRKQLSINLTKKTDSNIAFDHFLRQTATPSELSAFLSTKSTDELLRDKTCDLCCCDRFPESAPNHCVACMSLPNPMAMTCAFNPRDAEVKERLKLKLTKRTVQNIPELSKSSSSTAAGNKVKSKPCDNSIDDLVRFIDGDETTATTEGTSKKNKKKNKSAPKNTNVDAPSPPTSKKKKKGKSKIEEPIDESSTIKPPTPPPPSEKTPSNPKRTEPSSENPLSPEEEVNWITISRKQSKHKPTSVPSLLSIPVVVPPSNSNPKQKRPPTTAAAAAAGKTKSAVVQTKVIPETVTNSNKQQPAMRPQNAAKTQQQKSELPSAWTTHEQTQTTPVASTSTLLATAPVFVPASSLVIPKQTNEDLLRIEQPTSSLYWNPDGYLLPPPGPVQRPNSSFSPAPGPRCIRRPSPEPFPTYSPLTYTVGNATSTWNDLSERNPDDSQWKYPYEDQPQTSTIPNDFPLYDPFNSGTGLTIAPSSLLINDHLHVPQENDADEMDALEKEIEDFKKCYIDNVSFDSRDKRQGNIDHRFIRQS